MAITLLTDHVWQTLTAATKARVKPAVAVAYFGQGAALLRRCIINSLAKVRCLRSQSRAAAASDCKRPNKAPTHLQAKRQPVVQ